MKRALIILLLFCLQIIAGEANSQTCPLSSGINNEYGHDDPVNLKAFDMGMTDCLVEYGDFYEYDDIERTGHINARLVSKIDSNAGWDLELDLTGRMEWDEWSTQDFPTFYVDDTGTVTDEYLDWTYYLISCGTLLGWGNWEGSTLNISHAPVNNFYAFELGFNCNGWNSGFGARVWAYAIGEIVNPETGYLESVNGQISLSFDIDNCSEEIPEIVPEDCEPFTAGNDVFMCSFFCGESTQLNATLPCSSDSGQWINLSDQGIIEDATDPNTLFTVPTYGIYELVWQVECNEELLSDTVNVSLFSDIIIPSAGDNLNVNYCETDSVQLNGELSVPPGWAFWELVDGCPVNFSDIMNANATVSGLLPGTYVFSWRLPIQCDCDVYDTITVTVTGCEDGIDSCDPIISGCTLSFSTNYNPEAIVDDGTCEFDFEVCDCNGSNHSPYEYLRLGDGIPDNSEELNFNCEEWGYDCLDIEGTPTGDYGICNGEGISLLNDCINSISQNLSKVEFNIYPNPTKGEITVDLNLLEINTSLEIYDLIGRRVFTYTLTEKSTKLKLDELLVKGGYFIRVTNGVSYEQKSIFLN